MTSRALQFEHIVVTELPILCDDFNLETSARKKLYGYIKKLEQWMCGVLKWHRAVDRYKEFELRNNSSEKRLLQGPTGLGTAATQIRPSVGQKTTQTNVQPIVQNVLSSPTGLGTSGTKIGTLLGRKG
ncbi:hypothetical protein [Nostoc sp. 'Peltigera malacea cyanobiont' DB3992]|uniref:hypothetical protein n=1 Tax=Nostoc sp. 'Peltigera malacea cyanobiont' DB3992 TaxID=1206980 RepID=UPI00211E8C83|nr:hypothetical protein [Nostoc sp. 'Peltigera malacea cyanobiont' DB3992]